MESSGDRFTILGSDVLFLDSWWFTWFRVGLVGLGLVCRPPTDQVRAWSAPALIRARSIPGMVMGRWVLASKSGFYCCSVPDSGDEADVVEVAAGDNKQVDPDFRLARLAARLLQQEAGASSSSTYPARIKTPSPARAAGATKGPRAESEVRVKYTH